MANSDRPSDRSRPLEELHPNERIKADSRGLRGTLAAGLTDPITGGLPNEADLQLLRLHGTYQQDDRDLRTERRRQKLEPAYQLMMRVRLPGGVCQPAQWLALDAIARTFGNRTLRLTSRQTFQLHGVLKRDAKQTVRELQRVLLDTIAACGDVNRTVLCSPNPHLSTVHAETYALAKRVSEHLLPRTRAYYEIWLDQEPVAGGDEEEVIYGSTYLPRKFKIGFVVPPSNDIDVYAQDLGFVAIVEGERLAGFDVLAGGGMGRTDNEPATYPRLADVLGFCTPAQVIDVAENVVKLQRDFGNRVDRKRARLKYTIDDRGLPWFVAELERRLGFALGEARPFTFETHGDRFGWTRGSDGRWHYTLFVENGRIADTDEVALLTGLREIARVHAGELRLTPNQNLILSNVADERRDSLQALLGAYRLERGASALRRQAMACVALPTCGLAMAEAERYLPSLITELEAIAAAYGLGDEPIVVRMSGCPNGCSRPYLAEIAFTGRAPGRYNVYLGGGFYGQRLAHLYRENADEAQILAELTPLLSRYAAERQAGERFGDFVLRTGVVPVSSSSRAAPASSTSR